MMTDNEIIKSLECCLLMGECENECPAYTDEYSNCIGNAKRAALDLINRQKAEIERYKGVIKILEKDVQTAKLESRKEFAERLKRYKAYVSGWDIYVVREHHIDNLTKEMAGD